VSAANEELFAANNEVSETNNKLKVDRVSVRGRSSLAV